MDCAPVWLRMITSHYGKEYSLEEIREPYDITRVGVSSSDRIQGSKKLGLNAIGEKISVDN